MLNKVGSNHLRHKVKAEEFDQLGPIFYDLLKEKCGDLFDDKAKLAWKKVYEDIVVAGIRNGYQFGAE